MSADAQLAGGAAPIGADAPRMFSKGSLVALAHGIEASLLDAEPDPGDLPVVIALFQKDQYFAAERRRYRAIARNSVATIVGFVDKDPDVPTPIVGVPLRSDEPIANEFCLVIISKCICVSLIGVDASDPYSGERNRRFETRWSFDRAHAVSEARRIVEALGDRVPAAVHEQIDERLHDAEQAVPRRIEARLTAAFQQMVMRYQWVASRVNELEDEHAQRAPHKAAEPTTRDVLTGLPTRRTLARFLGQQMVDMPRSDVAIAWLDVDDLDTINIRFGRDSGDAALRLVADAIRSRVRDGDCVARYGDDEFVVIMPGMNTDTAKRRALEFVEAVNAYSLKAPRGAPRVSVSCGISVGDISALVLNHLRDTVHRGRAATVRSA